MIDTFTEYECMKIGIHDVNISNRENYISCGGVISVMFGSVIYMKPSSST